MKHKDALAIEALIRRISGNNCLRSSYIDADLIEVDCAKWLAENYSQFPASARASAVIKAWHQTAAALHSDGDDFENDQVQSLIADLEKELSDRNR